jgi:hypothetical protein
MLCRMLPSKLPPEVLWHAVWVAKQLGTGFEEG